ncbi:uncharacterized protein BKCO1_100058 [Diplodia corticola]|uniref:Transmembrane protein n=1 Tax=Diplodia corticola TaxID=236234 RepID=A0A1J9RIE6_9PEZI|nr:uncharacterized protein BKCO1_100058 [Diplodia corticola]OJD40225.1 transmembrane protein [Diplodia corticola]
MSGVDGLNGLPLGSGRPPMLTHLRPQAHARTRTRLNGSILLPAPAGPQLPSQYFRETSMDVKEPGAPGSPRQATKRTSRKAKREIRQKAKNVQAVVAIAFAAFVVIIAAMSSPAISTLNKRLFNAATYSRIQHVWFGDLPSSATTAPSDIAKKWFGAGPPEDKAAFDKTCTSAFRDALVSVGPKAYPLPALDAPGNSSYAAELAHAPTIAAPFAAALTDAAQEKEGSGSGGSSDIRAREEGAADAALSLILLLDQLSRNIFRTDQKLVYGHYDRLSRSLLRHVLATSPRADLHPKFRAKPVFRMWFYMPLMHSEFLEDHRRYKALAAELLAELEARGDKEAEEYVRQSMDFGERHTSIIEKFGRYPYRNEIMGRKTTKEENEWLEAGGETFGTGK